MFKPKRTKRSEAMDLTLLFLIAVSSIFTRIDTCLADADLKQYSSQDPENPNCWEIGLNCISYLSMNTELINHGCQNCSDVQNPFHNSRICELYRSGKNISTIERTCSEIKYNNEENEIQIEDQIQLLYDVEKTSIFPEIQVLREWFCYFSRINCQADECSCTSIGNDGFSQPESCSCSGVDFFDPHEPTEEEKERNNCFSCFGEKGKSSCGEYGICVFDDVCSCNNGHFGSDCSIDLGNTVGISVAIGVFTIGMIISTIVFVIIIAYILKVIGKDDEKTFSSIMTRVSIYGCTVFIVFFVGGIFSVGAGCVLFSTLSCTITPDSCLTGSSSGFSSGGYVYYY